MGSIIKCTTHAVKHHDYHTDIAFDEGWGYPHDGHAEKRR